MGVGNAKVKVQITPGMEQYVDHEAVANLNFGYAGANSVDFTDAIALEVSGVEDGNVYLTKAAAEYLVYSLLNAGVEIPEEFR